MGDSPAHRDPDTLYRLYHEQGKSQREIADELGVSQRTVSTWMEKHGIETRSARRKRVSKERLPELYHEQGKTQREIADELGVSQRTVSTWMEKHGIETRGGGGEPMAHEEHGYMIFAPPINGNRTHLRLHRLQAVAEYGVEAVKGNVVHHKNSHKLDNRPENLEVMSHSEHTSLHRNNQESWRDSNEHN